MQYIDNNWIYKRKINDLKAENKKLKEQRQKLNIIN